MGLRLIIWSSIWRETAISLIRPQLKERKSKFHLERYILLLTEQFVCDRYGQTKKYYGPQYGIEDIEKDLNEVEYRERTLKQKYSEEKYI